MNDWCGCSHLHNRGTYIQLAYRLLVKCYWPRHPCFSQHLDDEFQSLLLCQSIERFLFAKVDQIVIWEREEHGVVHLVEFQVSLLSNQASSVSENQTRKSPVSLLMDSSEVANVGYFPSLNPVGAGLLSRSPTSSYHSGYSPAVLCSLENSYRTGRQPSVTAYSCNLLFNTEFLGDLGPELIHVESVTPCVNPPPSPDDRNSWFRSTDLLSADFTIHRTLLRTV